MRVDKALQGVTRLYVDTAPFIYFTENRPGYVEKMVTLFQYVQQEPIHLFTAALTLTETLAKPLQTNDQALVEQYRMMFYQTERMTVSDITPQMGERAAALRAHYPLRTPDALHLAAAIELGCEAFATNDKSLRQVQELRVLLIDELDITQPPQ